MKKTLFILLILLTGKLSATPELDSYVCVGKNLTIKIIYRYKDDIQKLYFESLTKNLDEYIDLLKLNGNLSRGKINIVIMTGIWNENSTGIKMYRYSSGYYCWLNGLVQPISQMYLTKIIEYFASDTWKSFCYDETKISPNIALNIFNKRIDSIKINHEYPIRKVLELQSIDVYFQNDSLICKGANRVYGSINHLPPFTTNSKDFITIGNTFYVIENDEIINQIELTKKEISAEHYESTWNEIFPKWINYKNVEKYYLSYSIENNIFYRL